MNEIAKFAKSPFGCVLFTLLAVYGLEKWLKSDLANLPAAAKAKFSGPKK